MATLDAAPGATTGPLHSTGPLHHSAVDTQDRYGRGGLGAGANYAGDNYGYSDNANGYRGVNNRRIANPHPLGILAFGSTLFIYSLYLVHARGIRETNAILGMGLFVGGLAQLLAGMWAFPRGSTHAATTYTLYGAFWISLAIILIPGTGVSSAYRTPNELTNALGIYFMIWMTVTIILMLSSIWRHITFLAFMFFLTLFYLLTGVAYFRNGSDNFAKAGGAFGIIASVITLYMGLAKLLESDHNFTQRIPLGYIGSRGGAGMTGAGMTTRDAEAGRVPK